MNLMKEKSEGTVFHNVLARVEANKTGNDFMVVVPRNLTTNDFLSEPIKLIAFHLT